MSGMFWPDSVKAFENYNMTISGKCITARAWLGFILVGYFYDGKCFGDC